MKHCQRTKRGVPIIRLVKHVERSNFPMIVYRIAKNRLRRGDGKDLVQLTSPFPPPPPPLHTTGQKGETHWWRDSLRWCGNHTLIYRKWRPVGRRQPITLANQQIGLHKWGALTPSPPLYPVTRPPPSH